MTIICSVYGLYSTEDGVIRYIGQTTNRLSKRLQEHCAEAFRPPGRSISRNLRWLRKVIRSGYEVRICLVEANAPWSEAEKRWIAYYRKKYPGRMTNISDGGDGWIGPKPMEWRIRMRVPKSEAVKAKMRKPKSLEHRINIGLGQIGNTKSRGDRNPMAVLSEADVIDIIGRLQQRESISSIAAVCGVTKAAISKIRTGRTWKHLTTNALLREWNGRHSERSDGNPRGGACAPSR